MIRLTLKEFVKKNNYRPLYFVLIGIFIFQNGFTQKRWNNSYLGATLNIQLNTIEITIRTYDYAFGPNSEHGYLEHSKLEASTNNVHYLKIMETHTDRQKKSNTTKTAFAKKHVLATIVFTNNLLARKDGLVWPQHLRARIEIWGFNLGNLSIFELRWILGEEFKNVRYLRFSGKWTTDDRDSELFQNIIYDLSKDKKDTLNSINLHTITNKTEEESVNVLKDSESIFIKGTDLGSNIRVYSTSGFEIKSVISDNDVVKIKPPSKQIYIVHIGNLRHKVAF